MDVAPCSPTEVHLMREAASASTCLTLVASFLLCLLPYTADEGTTFVRNIDGLTGLHGFTLQKIMLFIFTAFRTSNPTQFSEEAKLDFGLITSYAFIAHK